MLSVGINVSKGKSTVCFMRAYGEVVITPYEVNHTNTKLEELCRMISRFDEEVRVIMEATGIYHLPVLASLMNEAYLFL